MNAGTIEILFQMRDLVSAELGKVSTSVMNAATAAKAAAPAYDTLEKEMAEVARGADGLVVMSQKQKMAMEGAHEAALKMNDGLNKSDDGAQKLSATVNAMSGTITASAAALGMP